MCLIAHRRNPADHIPNDIIDYNLRVNPDGFGIAWKEHGKIKYEKFAPAQKDEFRTLLKRIDSTPWEYVAHWRKATHGEVSAAMSHPFPYKDSDGRKLLAFHNGIFPIETHGNESDTYAFVDRILSRFPFGWWKDDAFKKMVEKAIGWSRVLLWTGGIVVKLNEADWKLIDGIDYSCYPGPYTYVSTGVTVVNGKPVTSLPTGATGDMLYEDEDDEPWEKLSPGYRSVKGIADKEYLWEDGGHKVKPINRWDAEDPKDKVITVGDCVCVDCDSIGEYYVIEEVKGKPDRITEIDHVIGFEATGKPIYGADRKIAATKLTVVTN